MITHVGKCQQKKEWKKDKQTVKRDIHGNKLVDIANKWCNQIQLCEHVCHFVFILFFWRQKTDRIAMWAVDSFLLFRLHRFFVHFQFKFILSAQIPLAFIYNSIFCYFFTIRVIHVFTLTMLFAYVIRQLYVFGQEWVLKKYCDQSIFFFACKSTNFAIFIRLSTRRFQNKCGERWARENEIEKLNNDKKIGHLVQSHKENTHFLCSTCRIVGKIMCCNGCWTAKIETFYEKYIFSSHFELAIAEHFNL